MNRKNTRLLAAALLWLPTLAFAQVAPKPDETPVPQKKIPVVEQKADDKKDDTVQLEEFQVTGSRIRTLVGEQTALPVLTLDRIELEHRGVTRLADIRWAIPQLGGTVGFNDNLVNGGVSRAQQVSTSFNLRGLGGNSTLVLVDGRRVPRTGQEAPGGAGGREDFNVDGIPMSAIERIEVLPQSAGAIYGAEGIAGVVNIILKKNFTGAELNVSYDNTFKSDVGQTTVSLTAGYRKEKLSTFLSASYEHQNGLASRDRWFSAKSVFPEYGGSTSFLLQQVPGGPGSLSSGSFPGFGGAPLPGLTTNQVGIPAGSTGTTVANSAYTTTVSAPFDPAAYSMLIDPATRRSVVFKADYDFAGWLKPYVEARWSKFENDTVGTPPIVNFQASLPAGYAGNPFSSAVNLNKVFYDLPLLETKSSQENLGLSLGARGDLPGDWRYDLGGSFARNIAADEPISTGFDFSRTSAAINNADPAKRPILAYDSSTVKDPNAAGVLDALRPIFPHHDTSEVYDYTLQADGTVWEGWAGPMKLAVGGESQEEKVEFYRTPGDSALSYVLTKPFSRRTTAAFAEGSVPLLSDKQHLPLVHRLEVGAAIRAEDYSDIGAQTSPGFHALFQPTKWITVRASRADGFKAPKLYDLLAPVFTSTPTLTTSSNVHDTRRGGELVLGTVTQTSGGNPGLSPETSVSKNWGVVVDVPGAWFKGLSFSVDRYELEYKDRIGGPSRQVLIDFFPERVTRAAVSPSDPAGYAGRITGFDISNINLSRVRTRGWDYQLTYQRSTSVGGFSVMVAYSEAGKTITKSTPAANPTASIQPDRLTGSLFWSRSAWTAGVVANYQSRYYISGLNNFTFSYPPYIEWNPQVSYDFGKTGAFKEAGRPWWQRLLADTRFSATVVNVFNREPSTSDVVNGRIVMDPRLRRYIVSFTKKL
ncbi:MAG: TonB-dependent receptor [Opitutae bacterium]|nr:TonB-dependent receptor [Opitutae bacterium]